MNYSPLKSTRLNISLKMRRKSESIPKCLGLWRSGQEGRCRPWHCDRKSCWEPGWGPREDYKCNVLLYFFANLLWKSQKLKLIILRFAAIATKRCVTEIVWSSITSCMRWCGMMMTCCYIRWCYVAWKAEPFVRLIVPGKQNGFLACTDIWFSENFLLMCFWSTFNIVQRKTNKEEYMSPKEDKKKKKRKRKKVLRKKERDIPTSNGQKIRNLTTK